ncbi:hypothetical protein [Microbacterium sp. Root180]|uniref:hypothetical protein n=1 Tax=Microbacterium sp. Root180 TaxID=1736483 RepID=UPI0006FE30CA|nr:hypothetical protein [Microbacterium sp. Root180]KRB37604.1 hypothetical protein ASD93_04465 [Microbacterium sp. Root180]
MSIPRQMINLLGIVLVVAVLVAGVTLAGVPLFSSAQTTDASTKTVAQTNQIYQIQVTELAAANETIDEIVTDVTALQSQITATTRMDDVIELAVAAADTVGGTIESFTVAEIEPWTPRTGLDSDVEDEAAPTDEGEAEDTSANAESDGTTDAADGAEAPAEAPATAEDSPQKQIPVTIKVVVPSAAAAAAFMDGLARGPRLIAPIDGTLEDGVLTVTALAFLRTGE